MWKNLLDEIRWRIDALSVWLCMPYTDDRFYNGPGYCKSCRALTRDLIDLGHDI